MAAQTFQIHYHGIETVGFIKIQREKWLVYIPTKIMNVFSTDGLNKKKNKNKNNFILHRI